MAFSGLVLGPTRARALIQTCTITPSPLSFNSYDTINKTVVDNMTTVTVSCNGGASSNPITLEIIGGNTGTCSRQMQSGANNLAYNVYTDAGRSSGWCPPTSISDTINLTGSGPVFKTYTVYGRIAAGQNIPAGTYNDALTFRLTDNGGTTYSGILSVSQTASVGCVVTGATINFGSTSFATATASASISPTCTLNSSYSTGLGPGNNASGGVRRMAGPNASFIQYRLYSDAARTVPWGDGTALGAAVAGAGTGNAQSMTVYGSVTAGNMPTPGSYTDTVVITVTY